MAGRRGWGKDKLTDASETSLWLAGEFENTGNGIDRGGNLADGVQKTAAKASGSQVKLPGKKIWGGGETGEKGVQNKHISKTLKGT